jgi:hypothetical protein
MMTLACDQSKAVAVTEPGAPLGQLTVWVGEVAVDLGPVSEVLSVASHMKSGFGS